ncbi:hypothetical protein ACJX0J_023595, partial [Zea mays]
MQLYFKISAKAQFGFGNMKGWIHWVFFATEYFIYIINFLLYITEVKDKEEKEDERKWRGWLRIS